MGCDIHLYKEKQVGGVWVAADEWKPDEYEPGRMEVPWKERFTGRNYQLFGLLSKGVRATHPFSFAERGVPYNACAEYKAEVERYGVDGHSHSYLYLHELKDLMADLEAQKIRIAGMKHKDDLEKLNESIASGSPDWELLFPYCQMTTDKTWVEFSVDVPADFYVGEELKQIIDGFNGIDGDNHRIVFFFDN